MKKKTCERKKGSKNKHGSRTQLEEGSSKKGGETPLPRIEIRPRLNSAVVEYVVAHAPHWSDPPLIPSTCFFSGKIFNIALYVRPVHMPRSAYTIDIAPVLGRDREREWSINTGPSTMLRSLCLSQSLCQLRAMHNA